MGDLRVFNGLVARTNPDGGFGIYSTAHTLIVETVRAYNPNPTFKTQKVLGRCRYIMAPAMNIGKGNTKIAKGEPVAYMGLSTNLKGAVFATKAVRANKSKSGQASEVDQFNLKGIDYKIEPKNLWAGQCFLPHYRTTCPTHLTASKRLASGEPLETILPDLEERERYLEEYKQFLAQLQQGKAPTPPALADISAADDTAE